MANMLHVLVMTVLVAAATGFVLQPLMNENGPARRLVASTRPPRVSQLQPTANSRRLMTVLEMMADGEKEVETAAPSSSAEDDEDEEDEEEQEAQVKQQEEEDPALVALKEEIRTLEFTLKSRRQQVQTMQDRAEHYSKAGYARKVAEMENMRRDRSRLQSSNAADAMAVCLAEFLPVLDRMTELKQQYESHAFGKSYNSLADTVRQAYTELGVTEYTVSTGDIVDKSRMLVVDTEYSNDYSADTVLRPISMGMELQGYIVRYAQCVASLGPETASSSSEQQNEAESAGGDDDEAPAEA